MREATERDWAAEVLGGARTRILVVDDHQGIRTALSTLLSAMGFQVTQAADGDEALELISREAFGVVFTDFEMPGMDGFTLASNIKSSSPKTPIIMITGSDQGIVREKMRNGCVDSVLYKPFEQWDIVESVRGAFRLREAGKGGQHEGIHA